jgi:hypothetical protein
MIKPITRDVGRVLVGYIQSLDQLLAEMYWLGSGTGASLSGNGPRRTNRQEDRKPVAMLRFARSEFLNAHTRETEYAPRPG